MGMDVNLYAEVKERPTDEQMAAAEKYFTEHSELGDDYEDAGVLKYTDDAWLTTPRVEVNTLHRYYSPTYERGHWPSIYTAIRVLQAAFPDSKVFYGSDSVDDGEECTDEHLAELWTAFLR